MDAMIDLIDALTASLDPLTGEVELVDALTRLCRGLCAVLPADGAAVCLLDDDTGAGSGTESEETIRRVESLQQAIGERLGGEEAAVAELFARLATALVLTDRARVRSQEVVEQLQHALASRVVIEQAKGMLAIRFATSVEDAFELMRRHARSTNQRVEAVAGQVVAGHIFEGRPAARSAV
jgi:hypothetical protein